MNISYRKLMPWLGAAVLVAAAMVRLNASVYVLDGIMLFFPLADPAWSPPPFLPRLRQHAPAWAAVLLSTAILLLRYPDHSQYFAAMLLTAAIPEEWFFRAYLLVRAGDDWRANIAVSVFFGFMHGITWGWVAGTLVFVPSLFYGWLYQRTRDVTLLALVHALSNLVFVIYLSVPLNSWLVGHGIA